MPLEPIPWWRAEPRRFARDQAEIAVRYPDLNYVDEGEGTWVGRLPRWPLDRPEPAGLVDLIGPTGLQVEVRYSAAYPVIMPSVVPLDPKPAMTVWTQHRWHVMGDGSLCLLQRDAAWDPGASLTDLLDKAAAWRVEYALLEAGALDDMTLTGIVVNPSYDHRVGEAVRRLREASPPAASEDVADAASDGPDESPDAHPEERQ